MSGGAQVSTLVRAEPRKGRASAATAVTGLVAERLDAAGLQALGATDWDALSADALEDNPFYARQHVIAGLDTIDRGTGLEALALRQDTGGRLCGLFLFNLRGLPAPGATAACNLYQVSATPLVHRDHAGPVIDTWLAALASGRVPARWSLPHIHLAGAFMREAAPRAAAQGFEMLPVGQYRRALLLPLAGGFEEHLARYIPRGRAKDIRRRLRRLEEAGRLDFERASDPETVARRVEDFLRLEHAGWKGAAGTSFLADPLHAEFARRAYGGTGPAQGLASTDSLLLDGRPIAVNVNISTGGTVFTPKIAFDETYRRFSPGLVLEYLVIEAFHAAADGSTMDASTTVDGHVVQGLWNAEKAMATVIVGPRGWQTSALARLQEHGTALKDTARAALAAPSLAPARTLLRSLKRKLQQLQGPLVIPLMCATQAAEGLVKVAI